MAVVVGAGLPPRMSRLPTSAGAAIEIRKIEIADVIECIAKGLQDLEGALYGMFFGAIYAIGGLLIVWAAFGLDYPDLAYRLSWVLRCLRLSARRQHTDFASSGKRRTALLVGDFGSVWSGRGRSLVVALVMSSSP